MAVESLSERPIFASEENEYLVPTRPPLSRLAIGSFVLGLLGGIALFNFDLVVLPILATALGLATYMMIARSDAYSGQWLAIAGMGLGLVFGLGSYTSTKLRDQYMYRVGSQFALQFIGIIADGKLLEAYELTKTEPERHVAGTSLEDAYRTASEPSKQNIDAFMNETAVRKVSGLGKEARWKLDRGVRVTETQGASMHVVVRLINTAPGGGETVDVTLARDYNAGAGSWYVVNVR